MNFLMNDLSFHGQFKSAAEFHAAVERLMSIRNEIKKCDLELLCHKSVAAAHVTDEMIMPQAIQGMNKEKREAWIGWLTKIGPYWEEERQHSGGDYLHTSDEQLVTDHALGEAAYCNLHNKVSEVVSASPSNWVHNPIEVTWVESGESKMGTNITNHTELKTVLESLKELQPFLKSWNMVEKHARDTFKNVTFSKDAFAHMTGYPYVDSVAKKILMLLGILNDLRGSFDGNGDPTEKFNQLHATYFVSAKPLFSDSSDAEKRKFKQDLKFKHPGKKGARLSCPWHGKINSNPTKYRIHFSWPIQADAPLYVVYIGQKLTKL